MSQNVQSSEAGLLPSSPDPVPPPGMKDGDDVWYEPPVLPKPGESGYWVIKPNSGAPRVDADFPNRTLFSEPSPSRGLYEQYSEPPSYRSKQSPPKRMEEIRIGSTHTVSERVLDIFRESDPDGVKWHEVDWRFKDGALPKYRFYWIHVTRKVKAIDFANSKVKYLKEVGFPDPTPLKFGPVRLMPEAYQHPYFCCYPRPGWRAIFISDAMRKRMVEVGIEYLKVQDLSAWPLVI